MGVPEPSHQSRRRRSGAPVACWVGLGVLLVARMHLLTTRLYDPDEFEHAHAAVCVARGLVPYRDFFEHHGPLTYYISAPLANLVGATPALLTVNRLASLLLTAGTMAAAWLLARQLYNIRAAVWALVWLNTLPPFVEKSVEWRPDVPAMFFVVWAAWLLVRPGCSIWSVGLPAGVLLGLASVCTLKALPVAAGLVLGALWAAPAQRRSRIRQLAAGVVGVAAVWLATWGTFAATAAGADFLRCTVRYPLEWPADVADEAARPLAHLWGIKDWSPLHLGLAVLGLAGGVYHLPRRRRRQRGEPVATLGCLVHLLSLAVMPTVYLQYYLLMLPILAGMAAGIAGSLWDSNRTRLAGSRRRRAPIVPLAAASGAGVAGMIGHAPVLNQALGQGLPHPYLLVDLASASLFALGVLVAGFRPATGARLLWAGLAVVALGRIAIPHFFWSGAGQRADLAQVDRLVPPDESILDGFTGLGCLRPHALYWWWINEHSLRLMQRLGVVAEVQRTIEARRPALVIYDQHLQSLGPSLQAALLKHYRLVPHRLQSTGALLFCRNDLP